MSIVKSKLPEKKKESTAMPSMSDDVALSALIPSKPQKLKLNDKGFKPSKTRVEMYNELERQEKKLDEDVYAYANPVVRGIAFGIDLAFMYGLYLMAKFLVKPLNFIVQLFLDKYKLQLLISQESYFV